MSSWAVLLALSGFEYDGIKKTLSFSPQMIKDDYFQTFWSTGNAWGELKIGGKEATLIVHHGKLELNEFGLGSGLTFGANEHKVKEKKGKRYLLFNVLQVINAGSEVSFGLR